MGSYYFNFYSLSEELAAQHGLDRLDAEWRSFRPTILDGTLERGPKTKRLRVDASSDLGHLTRPGKSLNVVKRNGNTYLYGEGADGRVTTDNKEEFKVGSVFTVAMITISLFEDRSAVGRPIPWAFGPDFPLTLDINQVHTTSFPYYSRHHKRIYFTHVKGNKDGVEYNADTALSPDIIAHEVAHAVIDGLAPSLMTSQFLEAGAIHESIADLTAFFITMRMGRFRSAILQKSNYKLREAYGAIEIAEVAGEVEGVLKCRKQEYLRSLNNRVKIEDLTANTSVHDMSQVLSGLLFDCICDEYERLVDNRNSSSSNNTTWEAKKAIWKVRAAIYRALDYLPCGDISYRDFLEVLILTDLLYYPGSDDAGIRNFIIDRAQWRGIELSVPDTLSSYDGPQVFTDNDSTQGAVKETIVRHKKALGLEFHGRDIGVSIHDSTKKARIDGQRTFVTHKVVKVWWANLDGEQTSGMTYVLDNVDHRIILVVKSVGATDTTKFRRDSNTDDECKSLKLIE